MSAITKFLRFEGTQRSKAFSFTPARAMIGSFALLIIIGTLLLWLPCTSPSDQPTRFVDALFVATSAVCVTGLSPVDIGTHFNRGGQTVVLVLYQLGGLGVVVLTSSLVVMFGGRLGLRGRKMVMEQMQGLSMESVMQLSRNTLSILFGAELIGSILLFLGMYNGDMSAPDAAFHAVFHSVGAVCGAGFSTFSDSLIYYRTNTLVSFTIMAEIVFGGIGVIVVAESMAKLLHPERRHHLSIHTRLVLITTMLLIFGGAAAFAFFERDNPQVNDGLNTITISMFQSITCRTAGFNTVDLGKLHEETRQLMMFLMFVGGAPGGTAGGIKVTTFAVLILATIAQLRGRRHVVINMRRIPWQCILQAVALTMLAMFTVFTVTTLLNIFESAPYSALLFETLSALGTVGLTINVTPTLCSFSKVILCVAMFLGRVGPLTLAASFMVSKNASDDYIQYPSADVVIG